MYIIDPNLRPSNLLTSTPKTVAAPKDSMEMRVSTVALSPLSQETSYTIHTYTNLLKDKQIEVEFHLRKGLSATICFLDSEGRVISRSPGLLLKGLPHTSEGKTIDQLSKYFDHTHLVPEKGIDGNYDHVSVHLSADGGVLAKIPFQPGLALGSVFKANSLTKMEEYAKKMTAIESITEQINAAEQRIQVLSTKIASKKAEQKRQAEAKQPTEGIVALIKAWEAEKASTITFMTKLTESLNKLTSAEIPVIESFQQGLESPIDFGNSTFEVQPRGFDSLNFSSQYIDLTTTLEEIHDKVKNSSGAGSAAAEGGLWMFSGKASRAWSDATSKRIAEIKRENKTEGVLMINALVTTRNVRCFTDLKFDKSKLKNLLVAMKSSNEKDLDKFGISVLEDGTKEVYLLTEAVLGGSFTALVTFLNQDEMKRKIEKATKERSNTTSASGGIKSAQFSAAAGTSLAKQNGTQTEDDVLQGVAQTRVNIEIISQGAMPIFTKQIIEHEIMKHLDLNPSKFELSKKEEEDAEKMVSMKDSERAAAVQKRQMKLENAQVAFLNTYRGLTSNKETVSLHTATSAMEAYESFNSQMASDPNCGIPVGFNYRVYDQAMLEEILVAIDPETTTDKASDGKKEEDQPAAPAPSGVPAPASINTPPTSATSNP